MDTLPDRPIALIAIDPALNIRRRWRAEVSRDLFGMLVVTTSWSRIGTRGQELERRFEGEGEALRYLATLLAQRRGAERRIGTTYREGIGTGLAGAGQGG